MRHRIAVTLVVGFCTAACEKDSTGGERAASSSGAEDPVVNITCGLEVDQSRFEPTDPKPRVEPVEPEQRAGQSERQMETDEPTRRGAD